LNPRKLIRRLLVAMLLGVACYAGFVLYRGATSIGQQLSGYRWETFGLALLLVSGNYVLRFLKWEFYLARLDIRDVPKLHSFLTFLSGFVLTVTPGKVGEVFKSLVLFETKGVPMPRTAPIVVAERLTDVIGVVVLVIIGSTSFPGGLLWGVAGGVAVLVGLVVIGSRTLSGYFIGVAERAPGPIGRLGPRIRTAWDSLRLLTSPRALVIPTLLSVASWALEGGALHVILRGMGQTPQATLSLFVYATSTLAGALIPVPGGLGVTEGSMEQQLVRLGKVELAASTTSMILVRFATLWFAVLLGFIALAILRARNPQLLAEEKSAPEPQG
jgi:glycosyltransferase 2 family protein